MKGPSLDAIRKFKEQQERKKREEDERKIKEKLSTLEHRAAQGDRKAKLELRKIEKLKDERAKTPEPQIVVNKKPSQPSPAAGIGQPESSKAKLPRKKVETDFDELMRLAKQNKNEVKRPQPASEKPTQQQPSQNHRQQKPMPIKSDQIKPKPTANINRGPKPPRHEQAGPANIVTSQPTVRSNTAKKLVNAPEQEVSVRHRTVVCRPADRRPNYERNYRSYGYYDEDEEEDEDDYESDGFVVDDYDGDIQDELRKTIKSVFRYDKRRCDLREEELDRQYRAIGRVSTFEDLEREERRASRLAAAEDAEAQRDEEERKRKKRLRLQKS